MKLAVSARSPRLATRANRTRPLFLSTVFPGRYVSINATDLDQTFVLEIAVLALNTSAATSGSYSFALASEIQDINTIFVAKDNFSIVEGSLPTVS